MLAIEVVTALKGRFIADREQFFVFFRIAPGQEIKKEIMIYNWGSGARSAKLRSAAKKVYREALRDQAFFYHGDKWRDFTKKNLPFFSKEETEEEKKILDEVIRILLDNPIN